MKLTLTYEDIPEEELDKIINNYIENRLYFSKRLELIKQGELDIKKKLKLVIENAENAIHKNTFNHISIENRYKGLKNITRGIIDDLIKVLDED